MKNMDKNQAIKRINKTAEKKPDQPLLNPETRRGIIIVVFFLIAALSILSFFNLAGSVGQFLNSVLKIIFGWGMYLFPPVLIAIGYMMIFPDRFALKISNHLGLFLMGLSFSGILHLFIYRGDPLKAVSEGRGGGYLGLIIGSPLLNIMGVWASAIVLLALLFISVLIVFSTSLNQIIARGGAVGTFFENIKYFMLRQKNRIARRSEEKRQDEYEEEAEETSGFNAHEISSAGVTVEKPDAPEPLKPAGQMAIFTKKNKTRPASRFFSARSSFP